MSFKTINLTLVYTKEQGDEFQLSQEKVEKPQIQMKTHSFPLRFRTTFTMNTITFRKIDEKALQVFPEYGKLKQNRMKVFLFCVNFGFGPFMILNEKDISYCCTKLDQSKSESFDIFMVQEKLEFGKNLEEYKKQSSRLDMIEFENLGNSAKSSFGKSKEFVDLRSTIGFDDAIDNWDDQSPQNSWGNVDSFKGSIMTRQNSVNPSEVGCQMYAGFRVITFPDKHKVSAKFMVIDLKKKSKHDAKPVLFAEKPTNKILESLPLELHPEPEFGHEIGHPQGYQTEEVGDNHSLRQIDYRNKTYCDDFVVVPY